MHGTGKLLSGLGAIFLVGGVIAAVMGMRSNQFADVTMWFSLAPSALIAGLLLTFFGRRLLKTAPERIKDGMPGTGQVVSTRDSGITINNTTLLLEVEVTASAPGIAPYPAKLTVPLGRTQWGAIQPGMTIPILIDRRDPSQVAYDAARPAQAGLPGAMGGMAGAGQQATVRSAADLIAQGVPVMGTLFSAQPAGVTAGAVSPDLPPDQADDPLVTVSFGYPGPDGQMLTMNAIVRVPDGKALTPNTPVPVRYLPDQPDTATIDWSRL